MSHDAAVRVRDKTRGKHGNTPDERRYAVAGIARRAATSDERDLVLSMLGLSLADANKDRQ